MGNIFNNKISEENRYNYILYNYQKHFQRKYTTPLKILVAHYTPATFPVIPILNKNNNELCYNSWKIITSTDVLDNNNFRISGITAFYNEFYERLKIYDPNEIINTFLLHHSNGKNSFVAKCDILTRIINFAIGIKNDDKETQLRLFMLGKSHSKKNIKPYMYSIFIQTLLQTISVCLRLKATVEVMEAWVHQFAFIFKSIIPVAIKNQVIENEVFINISNTFENGINSKGIDKIRDYSHIQKGFQLLTHKKRVKPEPDVIVNNTLHNGSRKSSLFGVLRRNSLLGGSSINSLPNGSRRNFLVSILNNDVSLYEK